MTREDLEARLAQAERERDDAQRLLAREFVDDVERIERAVAAAVAVVRARAESAERERDEARKLAGGWESAALSQNRQWSRECRRRSDEAFRADEAESLVALAMREGLAAVEAERGGRRTAVRAWLRASRSAVEYAELLRLALKIGLEQCEAERSRADRLEAACAAMREVLVAAYVYEMVYETDGHAPQSHGWQCARCSAVAARPDAVTHIPGCPLHPDAGARLLARLEAAERVAEACERYMGSTNRNDDEEYAILVEINDKLNARRAAKEA